MNALNCDDVRQTLISGATLLDVRTTDELNNGALGNAKKHSTINFAGTGTGTSG